MGGLFQAARAAQAGAGDSTTLNGDDSEPPLVRKADNVEPASDTASTPAFAKKPAPLLENLALAPIDEGAATHDNQELSAPRQEDHRLTKPAAVVPGPEAPANYRVQRAVAPETRYAQLTDKKDEIFKPPRLAAYPTEKDVDDAIRNEVGYADPMDGYFKPGGNTVRAIPANIAMQIFERNAALKKSGRPPMDINGPITEVDEGTARLLLRSWLAVRNVPIAALGFDPKHMIFSPEKNIPAGGHYLWGYATDPDGKTHIKPDTIWLNLNSPTSAVHESIHRGIRILAHEGALSFELNERGEEVVVRALMEKYYGPIEWGRTRQTDDLILEARNFPKHYLAEIESAAEKRYRETWKVDPSKTGPR